ncbi:hypothetical protein [Paenibacillus lautus]|uniref:hypothetical protein n=1 Tax=Paenibacillus lautus TaxID=1401 RepID=UPI003EB9DCC2
MLDRLVTVFIPLTDLSVRLGALLSKNFENDRLAEDAAAASALSKPEPFGNPDKAKLVTTEPMMTDGRIVLIKVLRMCSPSSLAVY